MVLTQERFSNLLTTITIMKRGQRTAPLVYVVIALITPIKSCMIKLYASILSFHCPLSTKLTAASLPLFSLTKRSTTIPERKKNIVESMARRLDAKR